MLYEAGGGKNTLKSEENKYSLFLEACSPSNLVVGFFFLSPYISPLRNLAARCHSRVLRAKLLSDSPPDGQLLESKDSVLVIPGLVNLRA